VSSNFFLGTQVQIVISRMNPQEIKSHCLTLVPNMLYHGLAFVVLCLSFHFLQNGTWMVEFDVPPT
jgi:hypothetical protein